MGAWAEDAFGNDTACDWLVEFLENPTLEKIEQSIQKVLDSNDYLDSDVSCEALVAIEIVARLKGQWGQRGSVTEDLDKWVEAANIVPSIALVTSSERAIARILTEDSELQELWDEDGVNELWHREMDDLLVRIRGSS